MVLRSINIFLILIVLFASICLDGCTKAVEFPENYPDYSSPENTFWTAYYAIKNGDYKNYLNSLSEEYKSKFGKTEDEQLKYCKTEIKISSQKRKAKREIIDIQYGDFGYYDVRIIWSEKIGEEYYIKRSWTPLKKKGESWEIVIPKE